MAELRYLTQSIFTNIEEQAVHKPEGGDRDFSSQPKSFSLLSFKT